MTLNRTGKLRKLSGFLLLLSLLLLAGCEGGRPHHEVQGTVKFNRDDSVARFGMIEFRSESEPIVTARSTIAKDGSFSLKTGDRKGAVAGWHTVVIMQTVRVYDDIKHDHGLVAAKKYLDHRTTDLRFEVKENSDEEEGLVLKIDNLVK